MEQSVCKVKKALTFRSDLTTLLVFDGTVVVGK